MTNEKPFKASNGRTVQKSKVISRTMEVRDADGSLWQSLGTASSDALREYFRHERDTELGRVRWPDDPNIVIYRDSESDDFSAGRCVRVIDEQTSYATATWEQGRHIGGHPTPKHEAAARWYFTEGPGKEPERPWEDAKAGEVWRLTVDRKDGSFLVKESITGTPYFFGQTSTLYADNGSISAGRKLLEADGSMADD